MGDNPRPPRLSPVVCAAAALITALTAAYHVRSYWRSDSLTVCDVTVTVDEGLASLQIPLTRLASAPQYNLLTYQREAKVWTAGKGGRTPLRLWMSMLDKVRCQGAMFADFGYWLGGWQSDSRPGPFIVLFAPTWFVGATLFAGFIAVRRRWIRFNVRTMLLLTTVCAGLAWLLTLRQQG